MKSKKTQPKCRNEALLTGLLETYATLPPRSYTYKGYKVSSIEVNKDYAFIHYSAGKRMDTVVLGNTQALEAVVNSLFVLPSSQWDTGVSTMNTSSNASSNTNNLKGDEHNG